MPRDLGQHAGKLDAGRARADHDERQPGRAPHRVRFALGMLVRKQDAAADLHRIGQRLQTRRVRRPRVVAEVAVRHAGGDDQIIVDEFGAILQHHRAARRIDALHVAEQHRDVPLSGEDMPDRRRNRGRGEAGGRDLVQQRLKQVVIHPVHHRHFQRRAAQRPRREQPAEAAAENDHMGTHAPS